MLVVTNRLLCKDDFLMRIGRIAGLQPAPSAIILREKDLSEEAYEKLAEEVLAVCREKKVMCILHTHVAVAKKLGATAIHLPFTTFVSMQESKALEEFKTIGVSIHSPEEAKSAERLGASYIIAGHIFSTDCKKDLPPRGLHFLQEVCESVSIPVYAIGGITPENVMQVKQAGAADVCVMSGMMQNDVLEWTK